MQTWADALDASLWLSIAISVVCGGLVGLERQLRGKPAGIRTSILICMGTMAFVRLGGLVAGEASDATRVLGQVVTGVGFLGAGVILTRQGIVTGVTSAATVWMLAGIGATIGFRRFGTALVLALVTVMILVGVEYLEAAFQKLQRGVHAKDTQSPPE